MPHTYRSKRTTKGGKVGAYAPLESSAGLNTWPHIGKVLQCVEYVLPLRCMRGAAHSTLLSDTAKMYSGCAAECHTIAKQTTDAFKRTFPDIPSMNTVVVALYLHMVSAALQHLPE